MINLADHPLLILSVALASFPVYRGLALAVFGNKQGVRAAVRHCLTLGTWSFFKHPFAEDWNIGFRAFFLVALCISFVAAICQLCVRYMM